MSKHTVWAFLVILAISSSSGCQTVATTGSVGYGIGSIRVSSSNDFLYPTPPDAYSLNRQGFKAYQSGDYQKAANTFSTVLQKFPENPDARFYLGLSQVGMGSRREGLEMLASFRDRYHPRQTSDIQWWANYFLRHADRDFESIRNTMRRVRAEAWQEEREDSWRGPGLGWGK